MGIGMPLTPEHTAQEMNDISYETVHYIFQHTDELDLHPNNIILAGYSAAGILWQILLIEHEQMHSFELNINFF